MTFGFTENDDPGFRNIKRVLRCLDPEDELIDIEIGANLTFSNQHTPMSANSHYIKAITTSWGNWDWKKGESEFLKAP